MATVAPSSLKPAERYRADQAFFLRLAIGICVFIVFGFVQWTARGFVDVGAVPIWVHLHGAVMIAWLTLFVTQNALANSGALALHRKLGWAGLVLALLLAPLAAYTGQMAVTLGRVPPIFTGPYFLALTHIEGAAFSAMVLWAIAVRRQTEWHRRLMLASLVIIMEPALGRLLPVPLLGQWTEWVIAAVQLATLGIAMRHDLKFSGRIHPALWCGAAAVMATHLAIVFAARAPVVTAYAQALAAG